MRMMRRRSRSLFTKVLRRPTRVDEVPGLVPVPALGLGALAVHGDKDDDWDKLADMEEENLSPHDAEDGLESQVNTEKANF